ncbi:hypothetical protein [Arthrobacter glacialis]|uniref:Uncharacterized protein n=1 Tax=Arthrobacter glacialis TaxID=1664 RepID=A0A2S3ZUU4_ARTGL|nr:hypothetical protein [Arthrobacter glacialis]POH60228.1 hypothetical protein CVS28_04615 [Arthrobacter glacialis]POH73008.1 hypothetical protein CVS27_12640 [Arthrobacter glacialis]
MFKKTTMFILMGLLAWTLAACGGGSGKTGDSGTVAVNLKAAISQVADVVEVRARYNVNTGMGSTASVLIKAAAGTESLETVLRDSLIAFAGASAGMRPSTSLSFQVTEEGQANTINPTAVGLRQSPSVQDIIDFANNAE